MLLKTSDNLCNLPLENKRSLSFLLSENKRYPLLPAENKLFFSTFPSC